MVSIANVEPRQDQRWRRVTSPDLALLRAPSSTPRAPLRRTEHPRSPRRIPRLLRAASVLTAALLLSATSAAAPTPAWAQDKPTPRIDDETRATARLIAQEGLEAYDRSDYADALDKLERANSLVPAPTLGLMIARCLRYLDRLVEASEKYLDVSRTKLTPKAPALFRNAVADAVKERDALMKLIPSITIVVSGPQAGDAKVTIDGKPLPPAILGSKRLTNPGTHRIEASRGEIRIGKKVTIAEGESKFVELTLVQPAKAPPPDAAGGTGARTLQRTLGWVAIGVGGAGLIAGGVTGGLAIAKAESLDKKGCLAGHCERSQRSEVDAYNTLRLASSIGLISGAVISAGGVVLLLTSPAKGPPKSSSFFIEPLIGIGAAGVRGAF